MTADASGRMAGAGTPACETAGRKDPLSGRPGAGEGGCALRKHCRTCTPGRAGHGNLPCRDAKSMGCRVIQGVNYRPAGNFACPACLPVRESAVSGMLRCMSGQVVICEKPSQARNLRAALGGRHGRILAARGHLYELAEPEAVRPDWKRWSGELLHPGEPFPLTGKRGTGKLRGELDAALKSADAVIIATDCDREGHLIGMEIVTQAKFRGRIMRAIFAAEDAQSLQDAFANLRPASEFDGLWRAGMARQQADQIVNLTLTRTVTTHMLGPGRGALGVGRVRTPTLAIVCRREQEIRDFVPENRLVIVADMSTGGAEWRAECRRVPGTDNPILAPDAAGPVAAAVKGWSGPVAVSTSRKSAAPPMPHDLSSLQQAMGRKRSWPAAKTLEVAQELYADLKMITYPRAEARVWPEAMAADADAIRLALAGIGEITGDRRPGKAVIRKGRTRACCFSDHRLAGASHHAIAPNAATIDAWGELWRTAGPDQRTLMDAVARRYLACTDADHTYDRTTAEFAVAAGDGEAAFSATGRVTVAPGWTAWEKGDAKAEGDRAGEDSSAQALPAALTAGGGGAVHSDCTDSRIDTRPTKPPGRYTEGGIIAAMRDAWRFLPAGPERERLKDASGLGTPATRDRVVETLVRQGQLQRAKGRFRPTELGMALWCALGKLAPGITDPGMTAVWEQQLDEVERSGGDSWWSTVEAIVAEADRARQAILASDGDAGSLGGMAPTREGARGMGQANRTGGNSGAGGPASERQLAFLRKLAGERGIELDEGRIASMNGVDASAEIERLMATGRTDGASGNGGGGGATVRQLEFIRKLAGERGIAIDGARLMDMGHREASAEIERLKGTARQGGGDRAPSAARLKFAEDLAGRHGIKLPEECRNDWREAKAFIDRWSGK